MFNRILVCLDGSTVTEQILPYAEEEARRFNSKLILIIVTYPPSVVVEPTTGYYHATSLEKIQKDMDHAATYLETVTEQFQKKGIDTDYEVLQGETGKVIVDYAAENNIDLIILGTHGRSGLGRLVFGSVTDYVLKHSALPILVKKPE